ncbi:MAG: efflux RND transporter periplasmic adaptor subunit [Candidatus Zixiibacteriota bacterium]
MKKKKVWIIIGVVVIVAVFAYITLTSDSRKTINVNAATVAKQNLIEKVSASGRIQPQTKVDITSEISGEIIALRVTEGQPVRAGQLLIVMDTIQIQADVHQARYSLDGARASLDGARASFKQSEEEYQRRQRLFEQKLASETELNTSHYAYLNARATVEMWEAQVNGAQAAYDKQLDRLRKAKIVSPMDGVVTFLDCEVGEIAAGQTAFTQGKTLMTISDMSLFEVEVEVDETEVNKIDLNQYTEIEVDAFPDTSFVGKVIEIGNTAVMVGMGTQDQSTNFKVKVIFTDANPRLRPGMSATVDITANERKGVLAVPFAAVVTRNYDLDSLEAARQGKRSGDSGVGEVQAAENDSLRNVTDTTSKAEGDEERKDIKGVFVIREGLVRFVPIQTGIAGQKDIEITEGLMENDSVVSGPYSVLRTLKDGEYVEIIKGDGAKQESGS